MLESVALKVLSIVADLGQMVGLLIFGIGFLGLFFKNTKLLRIGLVVYFTALMLFVISKGV